MIHYLFLSCLALLELLYCTTSCGVCQGVWETFFFRASSVGFEPFRCIGCHSLTFGLPCPLDTISISHLGGFVKGFSKLFLKKFYRPASLSITSVPPDIIYYSRLPLKSLLTDCTKFREKVCAFCLLTNRRENVIMEGWCEKPAATHVSGRPKRKAEDYSSTSSSSSCHSFHAVTANLMTL